MTRFDSIFTEAIIYYSLMKFVNIGGVDVNVVEFDEAKNEILLEDIIDRILDKIRNYLCDNFGNEFLSNFKISYKVKNNSTKIWGLIKLTPLKSSSLKKEIVINEIPYFDPTDIGVLDECAIKTDTHFGIKNVVYLRFVDEYLKNIAIDIIETCKEIMVNEKLIPYLENIKFDGSFEYVSDVLGIFAKYQVSADRYYNGPRNITNLVEAINYIKAFNYSVETQLNEFGEIVYDNNTGVCYINAMPVKNTFDKMIFEDLYC